MQVDGAWRAAANLNLLLGHTHPPARLEKPLIASPPQQQQRNAPTSSGRVVVEARNTANFRSSSYCGLQDKATPTIRRHVIGYYREMLRRIELWKQQVKRQDAVHATPHTTAVKPEPLDDDDCEGANDVARPSLSDAANGANAVHGGGAPLFRAVGILTQVQDPCAVGAAAQQAPWEFYVVRDVDDDDCYLRALQAMSQSATASTAAAAASFVLLQQHDAASQGSASARTSGRLSGVAPMASGTSASLGEAGEETAGTAAEADEEAAARDGTRLSLYTRQVPQFTGLYPGVAVGVIGEPFQRSARGVLTGVLVREFVLPSRPTLPWRVDRPLPGPVPPSSLDAPTGVRLHFCSGPFPRRDVAGLLRTVTTQALHRGADVLIIGGPFIPPFANEFERGLLPTLGATFNEMMEGFVDTLEETLKNYYATRPLVPHMKVLLVSHTGDVMQIPVLPTTMYAIADTDDILIRSNPCRLSVNGVHVSVCNEDVVGEMRERMAERWPTAEGSLRRVVEAVVSTRLYSPIYGFPVTTADLRHLPHLRMDYVPPQNELRELEPASETRDGAGSGRRDGTATGDARGWDAVFGIGESEVAGNDGMKMELKRVKLEQAPESTATAKTEYLPHIVFLPSTRPQFATVTHQCEEVDGDGLDDTASASGVLVVNQEVWSTRSSPKFELRVAEVTIPSPEAVLRRGATAASGVACGVLHIYSA